MVIMAMNIFTNIKLDKYVCKKAPKKINFG